MPRPTPAATEPATFRIISREFVIEPWHHARPLEPPLIGELADVPGYGRLARWERPAGVFGFKRYDPDNMEAPPEFLRAPTDEIGRLLAEPGSSGAGAIRWSVLTPTVREQEFARFQKDYPHIAESLGLSKAKVVGLFDPGQIMRPAAFDPRAGEVDWRSFVDRLVVGDFGIVGQHDPQVDMSTAAVWTDSLQPRLTRNSRAVARGSGYVVAAYDLESAPTPGLVVLARCVIGNLTLLRVVPRQAVPLD